VIRISQLNLPVEAEEKAILKKVAKSLRIKEEEIAKLHIVKRSIDARKKPTIFYSYVIDVELKEIYGKREGEIIKKCKDSHISLAEEVRYTFPSSGEAMMTHRPVVVGMGPAGLFCAYYLAKAGFKPIVLERGKCVEERPKDVEEFGESGKLLLNSNVQFGEGGAGTFSDGKLNTLVKDKDGRSKEVLRTFVKHGAPEKILYDGKPHIGTDILREVVRSMREEIIRNGGEVSFECKVETLCIEDDKIRGVILENGQRIDTEHIILAIGHSARDTFYELQRLSVPMEAKSFAVGFRVEHSQEMINISQYGLADVGKLGAAPYKVAYQTSVGRGVYSFCMCPGGYVVNASSEEGALAVNGMSYSGRNAENANSAIIVSVSQKDFGSEDALAGIEFQRRLERKAYELGKGRIPAQRYGHFKAIVEGNNIEDIESDLMPCTKGKYTWSDLTTILPKECNQAFVEGMEAFDRNIRGFAGADTILLGVESRTSSPVRIPRDATLQSSIHGLYPAGEGAGYAGGITSAAMDGMRIAEEIAKRYKGVVEE